MAFLIAASWNYLCEDAFLDMIATIFTRHNDVGTAGVTLRKYQ